MSEIEGFVGGYKAVQILQCKKDVGLYSICHVVDFAAGRASGDVVCLGAPESGIAPFLAETTFRLLSSSSPSISDRISFHRTSNSVRSGPEYIPNPTPNPIHTLQKTHRTLDQEDELVILLVRQIQECVRPQLPLLLLRRIIKPVHHRQVDQLGRLSVADALVFFALVEPGEVESLESDEADENAENSAARPSERECGE